MTLIAAYSHATDSFLIADTMISSRLPNLAAVTLPVSGRTYEPYAPLGGTQEYYVSTVTQKVHLISDHLAMARAGSRVVGESLIRSVMQKWKEGKFDIAHTTDIVSEIFDDYSRSEKLEVSIVGFTSIPQEMERLE